MPQNFLRGGNCPDAAPKLIFNIAMADAISADDRLARQAMEAFRRSQRPDGLINADTPTVKSNVIPAFSIYYLLMVHDHMMYLGDKALVKRHLPAIDGILGFFDRNLSEQGLVGKSGSPIMRHRYWSFIDWAGVWDSGVPAATGKGSGSVTMESLLYLYGLQKLLSWLNLQAEPIPLRSTGSGQEHFRMQSVPIALGSIRAQHWFRMDPALKNIRYTTRYLPS